MRTAIAAASLVIGATGFVVAGEHASVQLDRPAPQHGTSQVDQPSDQGPLVPAGGARPQ